jgi:uncharacterized protein
VKDVPDMQPELRRDQRDPTLDSIRAIALLGVVVMNIGAMVMRFVGGEVMDSAGPADLGAMLFDLALFQGKARSAFAFLFGVGFGILLLRAERQGENFTAFYLRRMAALILFGLINQAFFFWGDILVLYGLLGMAMLPLRHLADRLLLRAGLALVIVPPLAVGLAEALLGQRLLGFVPAPDSAQFFATLMTGSYAEVVAANLPQTLLRYASDTAHMAVYATGVLGLFMLGAWTVRRGIPIDIPAHRPLLRRVAWIGLPLGFLISAVHATRLAGIPAEGLFGALVTAAYVGLPVMALGAISALALWFARGGAAIQRLLAPVGRMALTNYLASGLIGSLTFYGYGLGLVRQFSGVGINLFALGLFAALAIFSHVWLARFRMGPAEWLWRCLSDLRLQPLRRANPVQGLART